MTATVSPRLTEPLKLLAPAKVNLALAIRHRRPDGFHELDTIFQALEVGDYLTCSAAEKNECRLICSEPTLPTGEDNLVVRAWRAMAEAYPSRVGGLNVHLEKGLPHGAGLGGGSSDATATLVALDRIYGLELCEDELEHHAAQLGSDCAFFVRGGTQRATGRGEKLRRIKSSLGNLWVVLAHPGFGSSTVEAYRRVTPAEWEDDKRVDRVEEAIRQGDDSGLKSSMFNVFTGLIMDEDLRYRVMKSWFATHEVENLLLAGSGSAVFALYANQQEAKMLAAKLDGLVPWVRVSPLHAGGVAVTP